MSIKVNEKSVPFIDLGGGYKVCLQDDVCSHGEEIEKKARQRINETPENLKRGLEEMRRLIDAEPDLCVPRDDDCFLKVYLRAAHYDVQEAFTTLQTNSKLKLKHPEYFTCSAAIRHVFEEGLVWSLPERNHDGSVVVVIESGKRWNPAKVSVVELNAAVNALIAVLTSSEEAQLHGCILLFDVEGLTMSHIMQFTPKSTGIMLTLIEKCSPIRVHTTQTINTGLIYNFLFAIIKPLQTKRMREMTVLHGKNLTALGKYISPEILPARFGGTSKAPLCDGHLFAELMMRYDPWFEKKRWDPSKVSVEQVNSAVSALVGLLTQSEEAQLHGVKLLFDVDGLAMSHIMQFTPKATAIMLNLIENCATIRTINTHTLNTGMVYNMLYSIIKPLQSKRMREIMVMHGRNLSSSLGKYINPKILPARFGGTSKAPPCDGRVFAELMMCYDDWLLKTFLRYGYTRKNSTSS